MTAGFDAAAFAGPSFVDALSGRDGTGDPTPPAISGDRFVDALAVGVRDRGTAVPPWTDAPRRSVALAPNGQPLSVPAAAPAAGETPRITPAGSSSQPRSAQRAPTQRPSTQRSSTQRPSTQRASPAARSTAAAQRAPLPPARNPYGQPHGSAGPAPARRPPQPPAAGPTGWWSPSAISERQAGSPTLISTTARPPASAPRGAAPGSTVRLPSGRPSAPDPSAGRRAHSPAQSAWRNSVGILFLVVFVLFASGLGQRLLDALTSLLGR